MVNGSLPPKILRTVRRLNSAVSAAAAPNLAAKTETLSEIPKIQTTATAPAPGTINLEDSKQLFSSVSTVNLLRSSATLQMAAIGPMVDFGLWVMNSRMMENYYFRRAVLGATERSFYAHFCAGGDLERAAVTVENLRKAGLGAMLDYSLEHADDNDSCDQHLREFLRTIDWTKSLQDRSVSLSGSQLPGSPDKTLIPIQYSYNQNFSSLQYVSFVVVKITALCPSDLLKRMSDLLRWEQKDSSFNLPWKNNTLPIFSESSPLYHTLTKPAPLTSSEEANLQLAQDRLNKICLHSLESGIPLLIDAEDTSVQPAIDYFTYSAAIEHSKGNDTPLIYNTIQAYLKDAKERLVMAKTTADKIRVPLGFKLVRGAYMSSENELANSLGAKSPIHDTLNETHQCYDGCAEFLLNEISRGNGSIVLATHNVKSCKLAAGRAADLGIDRDSAGIQFAQLYGMSEALSFGLRNAGFRVSKYLPYGPVDQVIPYLLRRAEENRGMLSTSSLDRHLMRKELVRRVTSFGSTTA